MKLLRKEVTHISRREFLKLILGAGFGYILSESIFFLISLEAAKHVQITEHTIHSDRLHSDYDNTFIVHFSDMHISPRGTDFINPGIVDELSLQVKEFLRLSGAEPGKTFIIDTGDIVSAYTGAQVSTPIDDLSESLDYLLRIPASRYFLSPGNHEYGHKNTGQVLREITQRNIHIIGERKMDMVSDSQLPFLLIGLPDFTTQSEKWYAEKQSEVVADLINQEKEKPIILAAHTSFSDVWGETKLQDSVASTLFLHGHTHGGQIGPNSPLQYVGTRYALNRFNYQSKYYRGVQAVGSQKQNLVSVSSGVGYAAKHRIRTAKPEVVVYRLRSA